MSFSLLSVRCPGGGSLPKTVSPSGTICGTQEHKPRATRVRGSRGSLRAKAAKPGHQMGHTVTVECGIGTATRWCLLGKRKKSLVFKTNKQTRWCPLMRASVKMVPASQQASSCELCEMPAPQAGPLRLANEPHHMTSGCCRMGCSR